MCVNTHHRNRIGMLIYYNISSAVNHNLDILYRSTYPICELLKINLQRNIYTIIRHRVAHTKNYIHNVQNI